MYGDHHYQPPAGGVRMDFNGKGFACFMLTDLERSGA